MNPTTNGATPITEFVTTGSNVTTYQARAWSNRARRLSTLAPTHNFGRPDYDYWRRAYRAQVRGLEVSGLLIKPIVSKIAGWVLGMPPAWRCNDDTTQAALDGWWATNYGVILRAYLGAVKQGDMFVVVNPDASLTLVSPDTVDPIVSEDDYSSIIGWRVTQTFPHPDRPSDHMVMIDEFYADRRQHRVTINATPMMETVYPNLLGRLPIIHIANNPDNGETFGHAEAEGMIELLHRYGQVMDAAVDGNILQGRPTPVLAFDSSADLDKFWEIYGDEQTVALPDGTSRTQRTLAVDLDQLLTISAATFEYKTPGSFTQDTERLLGLLFYLVLEHAELPEFIFGNAIASSKASAETQMPVFERFIEMRRTEVAPWLTELATVACALLSLTETGVNADTPDLQWKALTQDGVLTLQAVSWAFTEGLLDERTALTLAPLAVANINEVLELARAERDARQQNMLDGQYNQDLKNEIVRLAQKSETDNGDDESA